LPQGTNFFHSIGMTGVDLTGSRFLIYGLILVIMMLFRPEGLLPSRQRKAELHAAEGDPGVAGQETALYTEAVK
jgi:branched-chain amino acid transport system permease protein